MAKAPSVIIATMVERNSQKPKHGIGSEPKEEHISMKTAQRTIEQVIRLRQKAEIASAANEKIQAERKGS